MPIKPGKPFSLTMVHVCLVSAFIVLLDQFSKYIIQIYFIPNISFPVIKGVFHITLVFNKGAAFGLFKGATSIFIFISFLCIFAIIFLLRRNRWFENFFGLDTNYLSARLSLGLILGGAFGNLIDRLRYSYVVDFLDFRCWPVFNLADSAITIGGIIIFLSVLRQERKDKA